MNKELLEILNILNTSDTDKLDKLIADGMDIKKMRDERGNTLLLFAANQGNIAFFEHLIKKGYAEANEINKSGETALHRAVIGNQIPMVDYLFKKGYAKIGEINHFNNTALHFAARCGHTAMIDHLLKKGYSELSERDDRGNTAFLLAVEYGPVKTVELLLNEYYVSLEERNTKFDDSVLTKSAYNSNIPVFHYLLEKGAYIDMPVDSKIPSFDYYGYEIFLLANSAQKLLDFSVQGIKLNEAENLIRTLGKALNARQFKTGYSALHLAILNNQLELAVLLIERGADINIACRKGETPLSLLEKNKNPYFKVIHACYTLRQLEEKANTIIKEAFLTGKESKEYKEIKENKEGKEQKESKETKENENIDLSSNLELQAIRNESEKLVDEIINFLGLPFPKIMDSLILKVAQLFESNASPLVDPAKAYQILSTYLQPGLSQIPHRQLTDVTIQTMHKLMLELLVSKRVIFYFEQGSDHPNCMNSTLNHQEEENQQAFKYRMECIVKHILHCQSEHDDSLSGYITHYINGNENSLAKIEDLNGKRVDLIMGLMKDIRKRIEKQRKAGSIIQQQLSLEELEIEKLKLEIKKQKEENQTLLKQLHEVEKDQSSKQSTNFLVSFQNILSQTENEQERIKMSVNKST